MNTINLLQQIKKARIYGAVHLFVCENSDDGEWELLLLEKIVTNGISIKDLKSSLIRIKDRILIVNILASLLNKDMAYEAEIMPFKEAYLFANNFVSLFSDGALYFSNSLWDIPTCSTLGKKSGIALNSWSPLTNATFDSGIIICDTDKIGIAWFEYED